MSIVQLKWKGDEARNIRSWRFHSQQEKARGNKRLAPIVMTQLFYTECTMHLNYLEQHTGRESPTLFSSVPSVATTFSCSWSLLRYSSAKSFISSLYSTYIHTNTLHVHIPEVKVTRPLNETLLFYNFHKIIRTPSYIWNRYVRSIVRYSNNK